MKKAQSMAGSNTPIFLGLKDIEEGIEGGRSLHCDCKLGCINYITYSCECFLWAFKGIIWLGVEGFEKGNSGASERWCGLIYVMANTGIEKEKSSLMLVKNLEKRFGQSPMFVASTHLDNGGVPQSANPGSLLKEAVHVISRRYEDKSEWGKEVSS